jgi:hypothetical protein
LQAAQTEDKTMNILAYIGHGLGDGTRKHTLTDWHGELIGHCYLGKSWEVRNSYIGTRMYQVYATISGKRYTGRSWGEGMAVNLRECK